MYYVRICGLLFLDCVSRGICLCMDVSTKVLYQFLEYASYNALNILFMYVSFIIVSVCQFHYNALNIQQPVCKSFVHELEHIMLHYL
jgi:hypothetical protein